MAYFDIVLDRCYFPADIVWLAERCFGRRMPKVWPRVKVHFSQNWHAAYVVLWLITSWTCTFF